MKDIPLRPSPVRGFCSASALVVLALVTAACQSRAPVEIVVTRGALPMMERVASAAHSCWFKSSDAAFANYVMSPELNSYTGRPRILVVERSHPTGRPLLVVQAEGDPAKLETFGPMLNGPSAARIMSDVNRWAAGAKSC
jgi:hypothetical protein